MALKDELCFHVRSFVDKNYKNVCVHASSVDVKTLLDKYDTYSKAVKPYVSKTFKNALCTD